MDKSIKQASYGLMNILFFLLIVLGIITAAINGSMQDVTEIGFSAAKDAVKVAIGLIGIMAFWLGMMKILEAAGVIKAVARLLSPILEKLFNDIPRGHPALGGIVLNVSANIFGLGNAATPFGIKAMEKLQSLNPVKDTASHAMCLFLAINTSSVAFLPLGVIGVRAAAGASDPAAIWIPTFIATISSTLVAVLSCLIIRRYYSSKESSSDLKLENKNDVNEAHSEIHSEESLQHLLSEPRMLFKYCSIITVFLFIFLFFRSLLAADSISGFLKDEVASYWLMPFLMLSILCFGMYKGVRVYDAGVEGAKEGFDIAVRIIPYLVIILVAIGIFRTSGALDLVSAYLSPFTMIIGLPVEVLPMAVVRPLSGTGAFALMSEIIANSPNSYEAFVASVLMGSTETTFYVATVYFGSVGIIKFRYALLCGILADFAGIITGSLVSLLWY